MRDYFEIDLDDEELKAIANVGADEIFYMHDLKQRKLYLNANIDIFNVEDTIKFIMQYNADDKGIPADERKPITLYLNSYGGSIDAGFALIDAIQTSITPVRTVNLGYLYSMGFLIGLAGHERYAMPSAKFLMHDGSNFIYNSGAKAQDQMDFQKRVEERIKKYVINYTKITEEEYDSKLRVEWYMFADEAKDYGCVDKIIGIDCDIDEVI